MVAATSATSRASTGDVRPLPKGRRIVPSRAIDSAAHARKKKCWRKTVARTMHDRQPRPVQHLFGEPMLALLGRVRHSRQAHVRDGHLGDVDEDRQRALVARHGGGERGRLQVGRGHAQTEIQAAAPCQSLCDISRMGRVTDDDLGAGGAQRRGTRIVFDAPAPGRARRAGGVSPPLYPPPHPRGLRPR